MIIKIYLVKKLTILKGFGREELDFNSDIEVEEYSEAENEDEAMQCSQQTGQKH